MIVWRDTSVHGFPSGGLIGAEVLVALVRGVEKARYDRRDGIWVWWIWTEGNDEIRGGAWQPYSKTHVQFWSEANLPKA